MKEKMVTIPAEYLKKVKEVMESVKAEENLRCVERLPVYFIELYPGEYLITPDGRTVAFGIVFGLIIPSDLKLSPPDTAKLLRLYCEDLRRIAVMANVTADLYQGFAVWCLDK